MKISKIVFLPVLLLFSISVFAQLDGDPENWCRNGLFPRENVDYMLGKIKGKKGEKIYFYSDFEEDCPNNKNCRLKSYVIPNDEVIISRKFGNFACAWFQPKKGSETVGWIPLGKLDFISSAQSAGKAAWTGKWKFYDSDINIAATGKTDVYKITGNAFWHGLNKDNIHIGDLDGEAKLAETILKYGEDDADEYACKVTMRLLDRFMIVSDNNNCGGVNVSFSGVYRKK